MQHPCCAGAVLCCHGGDSLTEDRHMQLCFPRSVWGGIPGWPGHLRERMFMWHKERATALWLYFLAAKVSLSPNLLIRQRASFCQSYCMLHACVLPSKVWHTTLLLQCVLILQHILRQPFLLSKCETVSVSLVCSSLFAHDTIAEKNCALLLPALVLWALGQHRILCRHIFGHSSMQYKSGWSRLTNLQVQWDASSSISAGASSSSSSEAGDS